MSIHATCMRGRKMIQPMYTAVSRLPKVVKEMSVFYACNSTAWLEINEAIKKSTGRKALPPKMSLTAS